MNKITTAAALTAAFLGMGIAMPQCPGEKAMQQQVDAVQTSNTQLSQKVISLDGQVKSMNNDVAQTKQLMGQLATAVQAQKEAMDRMDAAIKDMQTKMAAAHAAPKARSSKKHKGR